MQNLDLSTALGTIVGTMIMLIIGILIISQKNLSAGKKEIEEKKKFNPEEFKGNIDVFLQATKDVPELHEYFVINKYQARTAFYAALLVSFGGFLLFAVGITLYFFNKFGAAEFSTLAGAIVEIIAGLFFWLYNNATKQMYIFYRTLLDTEKLLIAIQLVEKIKLEDQKDESYKSIINKILEINVNNSKP